MKIVSLVWHRILPAQYGRQKGTALFNQHLGRLAELTCLCSKLFAGTLDYASNAAAVEAIYKIIAPELAKTWLPFQILICGRNKLPQYQYLKTLQHDYVTYVGETDAIETYFKAADVFLNPVAEGGGMQTKTLDALSFSVPVVGFRDLHEELDDLALPNHLLLAESGNWNYFTALTQEAIQQPVSPVPEAFFDTYSFERSVQTFYAHLQKLIAPEYQHDGN